MLNEYRRFVRLFRTEAFRLDSVRDNACDSLLNIVVIMISSFLVPLDSRSNLASPHTLSHRVGSGVVARNPEKTFPGGSRALAGRGRIAGADRAKSRCSRDGLVSEVGSSVMRGRPALIQGSKPPGDGRSLLRSSRNESGRGSPIADPGAEPSERATRRLCVIGRCGCRGVGAPTWCAVTTCRGAFGARRFMHAAALVAPSADRVTR